MVFLGQVQSRYIWTNGGYTAIEFQSVPACERNSLSGYAFIYRCLRADISERSLMEIETIIVPCSFHSVVQHLTVIPCTLMDGQTVCTPHPSSITAVIYWIIPAVTHYCHLHCCCMAGVTASLLSHGCCRCRADAAAATLTKQRLLG